MCVRNHETTTTCLQEEELRASNDIKYQHLQEELHVEITAFAPPAEAHARIAYALTEVRKYLIPDSNDEIRQEQMREMEIMSANVDGISAAMAVPGATDLKRVAAGQTASLPTAANQFAAIAAAAMHPGLRPATSTTPGAAVTANLAAALTTPQSIQQAAVFRHGLQPNPAAVPSVLAAATLRPHNGQQILSSPYISAAPLVRKLVATTTAGTVASATPASSTMQQQQQKQLYNEEMLLEAAAVSQASSDINRDDG